jgi:hypothetical protein
MQPQACICNLKLLPQQLQQLQLDAGNSAGVMVPLELQHITALQQLQLTLICDPATGSALPAGLTALTVQSSAEEPDVQHLGIAQLSQLQQLRAIACLHQPEQLQQLSSLSNLTHIELKYETPWEAHQAACTWRHLSALRSIEFNVEDGALGVLDSMVLLQHLAAATSLQQGYSVRCFGQRTTYCTRIVRCTLQCTLFVRCCSVNM